MEITSITGSAVLNPLVVAVALGVAVRAATKAAAQGVATISLVVGPPPTSLSHQCLQRHVEVIHRDGKRLQCLALHWI